MLLSDSIALTLSMIIGLLAISPLDDSVEGVHRVVRDLKFVPVFLLAVCIHGGYSLTSQRLATKGGQARRAMARALDRATVVRFAAQGHGAGFTRCGGSLLIAFITDPEAPLDTACANDPAAPDFTRPLKGAGE